MGGAGEISFNGERLSFSVNPAWIHTALHVKDMDISALDFVAEKALLRWNVVAAVNISEGVHIFTARLLLHVFANPRVTAEGVLLHQSCAGDLFCPLALAAANMLTAAQAVS